jgi:hypothetical protein
MAWNSEANPRAVLEHIADYPINHIAALLAWNIGTNLEPTST